MRKLFTSVILLLFITECLQAQFETNYTPMVSSGNLPKDFVTLSSQKYESEKASLSKKEKRGTRKSKEKFILQSNFGVDDILLSGRVLFNDPLSAYVNKVADKLLEADPGTRSKLRFYVLKSSAVNAFTSNQGVIFVTAGLLAQVENEAQLAYILSHEVVHYKEQHAIEQYLEEDKLAKGKSAYKRMTLDEKLISKCAFSKEQEKEADEKGLQIFLASKYSTEALMGIYDVLKYAYLPFDDITFDKTFLENQTLKLPEHYILKETKAITTADIEDEDERSTHPNLKARRAATEKVLTSVNNGGKSTYLVGEAEFTRVREIARFEICRLYVLRHRYEQGLYTAYMLLKKYPENLYLKKIVAMCLSGLSQYSKIDKFDDVHIEHDEMEGKGQAVSYLMHKLDSVRGDITVVSVAYLAKLKKQYPNDEEVNELFNCQVKMLVKRNHYNLSDFSKYAPTPAALVDSLKAVEKAATAGNDTIPDANNELGKSKYEKLRATETAPAKKAPTVVSGGPFTKYAFVEYMNEIWFTNAFDKADRKEKDDDLPVVDIEEEASDRKRYFDKRTYALGAKKVVIVDPYFARINARKKDKYKFLESEAGQVDFSERLKQNAKAAKLEVEVLNTKNLKETETEKINELSLLGDYISDRIDHEKDITLPCMERDRIKAIAKKYNTDYFMWTGTISLTDKNRFNAFLIMYSILIPPSMPFILPSLINGGQYTLYFTLVYDVKTDKVRFASFREINNRTRGYLLDSHIYDVFNQIKSTAKK